jgi:hypothetical protein
MVEVNGQPIWLSHYAHRVWMRSHHGAWHLYGHGHHSLPDDPHARSIDVGVDATAGPVFTSIRARSPETTIRTARLTQVFGWWNRPSTVLGRMRLCCLGVPACGRSAAYETWRLLTLSAVVEGQHSPIRLASCRFARELRRSFPTLFHLARGFFRSLPSIFFGSSTA